MDDISCIKGVLSVAEFQPDLEALSLLSPKLTSKFNEIWQRVEFYQFEVARNGRTIKSYLLKPKGAPSLPCIVYNRGGIGDFGRIEDKHIYYILAEMAAWGYAVLAVEYGDFDEYGGEDVHDIKYVLDILKNYKGIDSNRIGLYGASRGGMMNYLLLKGETFAKCAVVKAGVSNQQRGYALRPDLISIDSRHYNSCDIQEQIKRSAVHWADHLSKSTPILLIHGTDDTQVSVLDTLEMGTKLSENKIPFGMLILNGDDHRTSKHKEFIAAQTKQWFDTYL
jgi:dipeptidyl aminopeptidase/acylaminoacyl peptidase